MPDDNQLNKKRTILYSSSHSSMQGGGQRSLYLILKYLDKSEYIPYLVTPEDGELAGEAKKLGIEVFIISIPPVLSFRLFEHYNTFTKLKKILNEKKVDLIHTESPRHTIYLGILSKLLNIPLLCHLRVSDSKVLVDKILYPFANRFIAVSKAVSKRFESFDKYMKLRVVYNAVELDKFNLSSNIKSSSNLKIGYFGRIDRRKGIEILLEAIKLIDEPVETIIMGEGDEDYKSELKKIAKGTKTIFRGYKNNICEEMSEVDVIALPSHYGEGLSRIIIESMALGKIIIVSDIPENVEALGDGLKEFSFPAGDHKKLAGTLKRIINNKVILENKKKPLRERAEECFDVKKNTKQIEVIYKELIERKK